jgi:GDSL-like Lipase/Acylhydrolase family
MPDQILPVAADTITAINSPLLTEQNLQPLAVSIPAISFEQPLVAAQAAADSITPLNVTAQNAVNTATDLLSPKLEAILVSDDGFSGIDQVTSNPDITGLVSDDFGVDKLLGKFTGQTAFFDLKSALQTDGKFTIDQQLLSQVNGKSLTDGTYQFEIQAVDLAGNFSTKNVQFTLDPSLKYAFNVNDNETTTTGELHKFKYTGNWNLANEANAYGGNAHWTNDQNASYEVNFYGSQAELYSIRNPWGGIAGVSIDGGAEQLVDIYGTDWKNQAFFKSAVLATGQHNIKVRVTGQKNALSGDHMISIDRLEVISPTLESSTGNINPTTTNSISKLTKDSAPLAEATTGNIVPTDSAPLAEAISFTALTSSTDITTIATINNPALLFSPYGWGAIDNGVQTSNAGAYIKFRFNGSQATLNVDTSSQTSFPLLDVYVDGQQTGDQLWLKNATNGQVNLFSGSTGDHDVVVYFRRRELYDSTNPTVAAIKPLDWLTDAEHLRVTGVEVTGGSGFLANSFARSKTAVFFGDSITEGGTQYYGPNAPDRPVDFPFTDVSNTFSYKTYAARLGDLLNVEYGQVGWSGSGWVRPSTITGNPPVLDSWLRYNGQSTVERNFSTQPDYVFMNLGTNDFQFNPSESSINFNVTDTAYTWLKEARQRIPGAEIFVIYPFNQSKNAELRQGIVRYLADNPGDTKVHALNLGAEGARGLGSTYIPELAIDGVHPTASRHQQLAGLLYDQIKPIIGVSSTIVEDTSTASGTGLNTIKYTGLWRNEPLASNPSLSTHLSSEANATYEVTFRGDRFRLFGNKDLDNGIAAISIDGGTEINTDLYNSNPLNDALLYQSSSLGNSFHTIKVRVTGQRNIRSSGNTIDLGKLEIF